MAEYILVGCDLHDEKMVLRIAADKGPVEKRVFSNTRSGHQAMLSDLRRRSVVEEGAKVIVAYEAGPHGFVLYDAVSEAGMACRVLAPTHLPQSPKARRSKSDGRDSRRLLRQLRAHLFAEEELHDIWVPEPGLRDERELVRVRTDGSPELTRTKNRIQMLLKRYGVRRPVHVGSPWTARHRAWLECMAGEASPLGLHTRLALAYQLDHLTWLEERLGRMDEDVADLAATPRYAEPVRVATEDKGVGVLTAMVFLTEMGDLRRFTNRADVGDFLGLVPSRDQSGADEDGFGHITHQGPARVRWVLNQSVWMWIRTDPRAQAFVERLARKHPKYGKRIAVVALMRRRAVRLWHRCLRAQLCAGSFGPPVDPASDPRAAEPGCTEATTE
jgi:transposase